jgi:Domain of unknown function (DUF6265)
MNRKLVLLMALSTIGSNLLAQKADAFKWVVGNWKINTGNGMIAESWQLVNDSTLEGKSYFIKINNDSIPQESLQLAFREGSWYYISTVNGQNNNQPVSFKVIFLKGTEFISENPAHDFPQRIAYRRIGKQVFASIEGSRNGKYAKINFDFTGE